MFQKSFIILWILLFFVGCASSDSNSNNKFENQISSPEKIYIEGKQLFDNGNYLSANEKFEKLVKLYPLSKEATQAEIMSGFVHYIRLDYEKAIVIFNRIIVKYPSLKNLDYVYYMKAICFYEQISHHGLDGQYNELALEYLNQVIQRFPQSKYAKDSQQKIIFVKSNQAAKHMDIGRFYLKEKKYTAALSRFNTVIDDYSMTKFVPEALHRMVEAYYEMGMYDESFNTASVLGYNYPDSRWYKHSYNLIKNLDENNTLLKKMSNFFD